MLAWLVCHNADTETANRTSIFDLSRHLEKQPPGTRSGAELAETEPSPRVLKTHLPEWCFVDTFRKCQPRVIVVMRNPKDVITSYNHMHKDVKMFGPFKGSFYEFFELFKNKELMFGDVFHHNLCWWKHRDDEGYLFMKYEDMKRDLTSAVTQIADLCDVTLSSEKVHRITEYCQFDNMKKSKSVKLGLDFFNVRVDTFMRKGIVGDWKSLFSAEQSRIVDKLCQTLYTPAGITVDVT